MISQQEAAKQIPWVRIEDQSVIADPSQQSLILFNQSATLIWQDFRAGKSLSEIIQAFQDTYQISADQAATDVHLLISQWRKSGLMDSSSFKNQPGRWQKHEHIDCAPLSDKIPLKQSAYQLHKQVFVVDYYNVKVFDIVHTVLEHLQVNISDDIKTSGNIHRYQIDFTDNYQLAESNRPARLFATPDQLVEVIQWTLIERAYQNKNWLTVLHSTALGMKNGQAAVFIAQRGSGKSTLCRFLQHYGLIYLADDVVPVSYSGMLQPMPMCQRFKHGSWKILQIQDSSYNKTYARQEGQYVKYVKPLTGSTEYWAKNWAVQSIIYPQFSLDTKHHQLKELDQIESLAILCNSGSVFGGAIGQSQLESIVSWNRSVPSYSLTFSQVNSELVDAINSLGQDSGNC